MPVSKQPTRSWLKRAAANICCDVAVAKSVAPRVGECHPAGGGKRCTSAPCPAGCGPRDGTVGSARGRMPTEADGKMSWPVWIFFQPAGSWQPVQLVPSSPLWACGSAWQFSQTVGAGLRILLVGVAADAAHRLVLPSKLPAILGLRIVVIEQHLPVGLWQPSQALPSAFSCASPSRWHCVVTASRSKPGLGRVAGLALDVPCLPSSG